MKLPQTGEIVSYTLSDAVGRIRLDDGTELRFGATSLHGVAPAIGLRVIVTRVVPHPLGGLKAADLSSAERDDAAYKAKVAEFESAAAAEIAALRPKLEEDHRLMAASIHPAPLTEEEAQELAEVKAQREAAGKPVPPESAEAPEPIDPFAGDK